jgi:hypothetical protein
MIPMTTDTDATALRTRLKVIVKEAEEAEAKAAAARRRVQAARLLEEEETKAAALEQTATAAQQHLPSSSAATPASQVVPVTSSSYEDIVVADLHLQVAAVLNVRQQVNIVLDSTNYASWRDLMEQALQRYALITHVTDDAPSDDPGWIRMDSIVLNWISNSISSELHQVVRERGWTARHLWLAIENQFLGNLSNVLFILTLPFVTLFRATSRCLSTAASSRLWPTVSPTSTLPLKTASSFSTFFGG